MNFLSEVFIAMQVILEKSRGPSGLPAGGHQGLLDFLLLAFGTQAA